MISKQDIDHGVQELLFNHDCVILPDFGGFVALNKPASFNKQKNILTPPSKQVSFNVNLKNNDGLLINHLAQNKTLSYKNAHEQIQKRIEEFRLALKENKRLEVAGVGVLYVDGSNNYRFIPEEESNFLKASFGLGKVYLTPQAQEKPVQEEPKKKRNWTAAAILVPLALVGAYWLGSSLDYSNMNMANFNPFKAKKEIQVDFQNQNNREVYLLDQDEEKNLADWMKESADRETIQYSFVDGQPSEEGIHVLIPKKEIAELETNTEIKEEKSMETEIKEIPDLVTSNESKMNAKGWYIVGGAFAEKSNAEKMVNKLKSKGYASFIFQKNGVLNMVCYEHYTDENQARQALTQIKLESSPAAWLKRIR